MTYKILCVDDEMNVLTALQRQLRRQFPIDTAQGGEQGLALVAAQGPYAVIISDMRMPQMNGAQFLARVRELAPESVRMMLTGNADQQTAIDAVNTGQIFRFLTKPCTSDILTQAIAAGIEQYRLITAEKDLLERTLRGSIKVLTEVLGLVNPSGFGRAAGVQRRVQQIAAALKVEKAWELEIAALLSQIGCVSVPEDVLRKLHTDRQLSLEEARMVEAHPQIGHDLIAQIPRLEPVAEAIRYQNKHFDGTGYPNEDTKGNDIPLSARILKVALDFERLESTGLAPSKSLERLREDTGCYDSEILHVLERVLQAEMRRQVKELPVTDLACDMILEEDLVSDKGLLLVGKGQAITHALLARLRNFCRHTTIRKPIRVLVAPEAVASVRN